MRQLRWTGSRINRTSPRHKQTVEPEGLITGGHYQSDRFLSLFVLIPALQLITNY